MLPLALLIIAASPQDPASLELVQATQTRRTQVVARVAPAVCAVMPLKGSGGGSGVIIDPAGFVLSNFHVVKRRTAGGAPGAPKKKPEKPGPRPDSWPLPRYESPPPDDDANDPVWKVMKIGLPDGKLYLADLLGIDPGSDLAVLLLRPRPEGGVYPHAQLGDSDKLLVGESSFAMGNPFLLANDFTPTVTWGIVSGTHRYQGGTGPNGRFLVYPDCVQVDAPVNPGNSGGPLFNEEGHVVGINGRISVRDRGRVNTGVGFAIASNQIRNFLGDLMAGKHAEHGTLDANAWFMKAPSEDRRGVFVQGLFADSKIAGLGVRLGDEITSFNGEPVRAANQLATLVGVLPAGSWVSLGFRSQTEKGGYGKEKAIVFQLTAMDTGTSRHADRLAGIEHRQLARSVLAKRVGAGEEESEGAAFALEHMDGRRITTHRLGDRLRWSDGAKILVRTAAGRGFKQIGSDISELTAEEMAKLERSFTTNPFLWQGAARRELLGASALAGGTLVLGRPAYRFRLEGEGEREVWLYEDGTAAGWRYRDPVAKGVTEVRVAHAVSHLGGQARVVTEGKLDDGWRRAVASRPTEKLFRRPGQ